MDYIVFEIEPSENPDGGYSTPESSKYVPVTGDWVFYHKYFKWSVPHVVNTFLGSKIKNVGLVVSYRIAIDKKNKKIYWCVPDEAYSYDNQCAFPIPDGVNREMAEYFSQVTNNAVGVDSLDCESIRATFTIRSYTNI